jgi:hypothetical protein
VGKSYASVLCPQEWPSLPVVTELEHGDYSPAVGSSGYVVQSPMESPQNIDSSDALSDVTATQDDTLEIVGYSLRNNLDKMDHVLDRAENLSKKRNLEDDGC